MQEQTTTSQQPPATKKPNLVVLSVLLLIVVSLVTYLFLRFQTSSQQISDTSSAFGETAQEDQVIDWQTYTNEEFGFSFEYPADIFIAKSEPKPDYQHWSSIEAAAEENKEALWLNISFSTPEQLALDYHQQIIDQAVGTTEEDSAVTKLSKLSTNDVIGATYYQAPASDTPEETRHSYRAVWIRGQQIFLLSIFAPSLESLENEKSTFNQILESFQFTK